MRAAGAGRKQKLAFTDRLLVTLVYLRHQLPHAALAQLYEVDRSTVSAAIREVRPLLAARGFAVPDRPGVRLRTLEDVFAYAAAEGVDLRIDGTEVQVRRPRAGRPGRKAFVSGKKKQNTIKTTTFSDHQGRTLFSGVIRPGRMHDQTAVRTEGIAEQFHQHPMGRRQLIEAGGLLGCGRVWWGRMAALVQPAVGRAVTPVMWSQTVKRVVISARYAGAVIR
ncbi:hypothetical protein ABIE67_009749 [Streptomyces sp. V4I8]|uniref:transposase family protein n=1 Tax=Streptomyces sp. V4I8 TaxID=3156469 RepID=UPI003511CAA6